MLQLRKSGTPANQAPLSVLAAPSSLDPTIPLLPTPDSEELNVLCNKSPVPDLLTVTNLVCPKRCNTPEQRYTNGSFTLKIRYRLSSFTRKPGIPFWQTSSSAHLDVSQKTEPRLSDLSSNQPESRMPSKSGENPSVGGRSREFVPANLHNPPQVAIDIKSPGGRKFLRGGLAKAHKFFGRVFEVHADKDTERPRSGNNDDAEDDMNMLYSNVMIPLDFPDVDDDEDGGTTSSPTSPVKKDLGTIENENPHFRKIENFSNSVSSSFSITTGDHSNFPNQPLGLDPTGPSDPSSRSVTAGPQISKSCEPEVKMYDPSE